MSLSQQRKRVPSANQAPKKRNLTKPTWDVSTTCEFFLFDGQIPKKKFFFYYLVYQFGFEPVETQPGRTCKLKTTLANDKLLKASLKNAIKLNAYA